jgi:hypothetical protein
MSHRFGFAPLQATFHRTLLDGVDLIPTQAQSIGHRLLAGDLKPMDRQPSKIAVKRLDGSAQGSFTARGPCSGQALRGGSAFRIVRYWQVSRGSQRRSGWWS